MNGSRSFWSAFVAQLDFLPAYLGGHLRLTLAAMAVATCVTIPLGIAVSRRPGARRVVVAIAGVIQTVPGLALLAVMVPVLGALGLSPIGFLPAFLGVTLYCVLPILFGTITGLAEVPPQMREAADGVGMTPWQRLRLVEIPLALPTLAAGLRTASMWCVGMATLSTPVGATSLGNYIFGGLQMRNFAAVIVGCVAAATLAQGLDRLWESLEVGLRTRARRRVAITATVFAALYAVTFVPLAASLLTVERPVVRVGSKTFTEQYVLAEVLALAIERGEPGVRVARVTSLGSTVAFDALARGEIDTYVDYSGTLYATLMEPGGEVPGRREVLERVRRFLRDRHGVEVLAALGFENTYALAMREADAARSGVTRISDLTPRAGALVVGADYELFDRPEWRRVASAYSLRFAKQRTMDPALMYEAIREGAVDVIGAYSTDGRIDSYSLRTLVDDRGAIPPYDALVLASPTFVTEHPDAAEALRALERTIDAEHMRRMNRAVDERGKRPRDVAREGLGW